MLPSPTPTEVSFLTAAVIHAVASVAWTCGALTGLKREARRAMLYWATWAALSSITWVVLATRIDSPLLIGIVCGVLGACALQRGIRIHIGRSPPWRTPMTLLAVVSAADWLGADPAYRNLPVAINIGALEWLYFAMTRDLYGHARADVRMRWPSLLALPVLLGAMVFASRSLRA